MNAYDDSDLETLCQDWHFFLDRQGEDRAPYASAHPHVDHLCAQLPEVAWEVILRLIETANTQERLERIAILLGLWMDAHPSYALSRMNEAAGWSADLRHTMSHAKFDNKELYEALQILLNTDPTKLKPAPYLAAFTKRIAELKLLKGENYSRCTVIIYPPYLNDAGSWTTTANLQGLYPHVLRVKGEDSMQSLCLCVKLIGSLINTIQTTTEIYADTPERERFNLSHYFPFID